MPVEETRRVMARQREATSLAGQSTYDFMMPEGMDITS